MGKGGKGGKGDDNMHMLYSKINNPDITNTVTSHKYA